MFRQLLATLLTVTLMPMTLLASPIEEQIAELRTVLSGKRVGFLTNPTSVDASYRHLADRLHADPEIDLVAFFAPEHGFRGDVQAGGGVQDYVDEVTGLPVYSLYGSTKAPTAEQLETVDVVLFDIQDVGARFYTFVWTMTHAMEAAAANGKGFVVFDRPNPIGLQKVEGAPNVNDEGLIGRKWASAPFGVATRHGMTVGEVATLVNTEWMEPKVELSVIKVPGLTRSMTFQETGYPWVMPSPNMPTLDTAFVYTGTCVFEGANVSEGRGTTKPFELVGAPFMKSNELAAALNNRNLPGVRFRAASFTPTFDDHAGNLCNGVQVHITDTETFDPIRSGLAILKDMHTLYPEDMDIKVWTSRLMGVPNLHETIKTEEVDSIIDGWQENLAAFKALREKHLLYPNGVGTETVQIK